MKKCKVKKYHKNMLDNNFFDMDLAIELINKNNSLIILRPELDYLDVLLLPDNIILNNEMVLSGNNI